ncbi:MAG: hypothetical protein DHS20C15_04800 [Planctomycetota bacterium]|nr:MAG: hypothetical protein DHS20C15_04800 [Planctomycetota bacterium]
MSTPELPLRQAPRARVAVRGAWLALICALPLACGITRVPQDRGPGPAALPNLRRASEALQARIQREQQHVDAFNRQLAALQQQEERLAGLLREAEADYQRLQDDYDFAATDVDVARDELAALQADQAELEIERANLDEALEASQARQLEAESELARVSAAAGLAAGRVEQLGRERAAWRGRLEVYRARWSVPSAEWDELLVELGLIDAPPPAEPGSENGAGAAEPIVPPAAPEDPDATGAESPNAEPAESEGEPEGESEGGAEGGAEPEPEAESPAESPDDAST